MDILHRVDVYDVMRALGDRAAPAERFHEENAELSSNQ
jgi:hypothetical protein